MNLLRGFEVAVLITTLVGAIIGGFVYLEDRHASRSAMLKTELDVRAEIIDRDIKKDAEARVYYKDISKDRQLEPAEESRLDYLEEQLERKYVEQDRIQARLMELEE